MSQLIYNLYKCFKSERLILFLRLWLSSSPTPQFPISILQAGIKITTEPPKGLKANMKRLYGLITETQFDLCQEKSKYKKLLFTLIFFHSILLERKKFQQLGWNVVYSFNDSDFEVFSSKSCKSNTNVETFLFICNLFRKMVSEAITFLIRFKFVSSKGWKDSSMIEKHNCHNSRISVPGFREPAASLPGWISSHTMGIFEISHSRCLLWWSRDRWLGSSVVDDIHPAIFHGRCSDYPPLSFVITAHLLRASRRTLGVLPRFYRDSAEHR